MVCTKGDYSGSSAGIVLNTCLSCQATSGYVSGDQSDLDWFLCKSSHPINLCLYPVRQILTLRLLQIT